MGDSWKKPDLRESRPIGELSGEWSFLPYEEEQEVPRRELQVLRALHSLVIPAADVITLTISVVIAYLIARDLVNDGHMAGLLGAQLGQIGD